MTTPPTPLRPLEERYPSLYYDVYHERDPKTNNPVDRRVAKATLPTLRDVILLVLSSHGVTDAPVASDLVSSVTEFTAAPKKPEPTPVAVPQPPPPQPLPPPQQPKPILPPPPPPPAPLPHSAPPLDNIDEKEL